MKISRPTVRIAMALIALTASFVTTVAADPDPEVCYERCLEMVRKGKIKDKKMCEFCFELKKQDPPGGSLIVS